MKLTETITLTMEKAGTMYTSTPLALTSGTEVRSERCQISKMKLFARIACGFQLLTIFAKSSILDIWQVPEYTLLQ